jgi:hypothetical protein
MNNKTLGWVCSIITCVGATLTTFKVDPWNIYILLIGTILYTLWSCRIKDGSLMFINGYLLLLYIYGFSVRIAESFPMIF